MFQTLNGNKYNPGFMLLEIIIAIALITIAFVALLGAVFLMLNVSNSIKKETQANSLMIEEFEALRSFRDGTQWSTNGLGTVNTGISNPYYLANNSGIWVLAPGIETMGIFNRHIVFDKVSRDTGTHNIEATYNILNDDANTRKVTIIISWPDKLLQSATYLTNWKQ